MIGSSFVRCRMGTCATCDGYIRTVKFAFFNSDSSFNVSAHFRCAPVVLGSDNLKAAVLYIYIINRNADRGTELAEVISKNTAAAAEYFPWQGTAEIPAETDILINATCVGLHPDVDAFPDINYDCIREGMPVCDVVFNPVMPLFLKKAEAKGAKVITGIGMLVNQGALNFEWWTGVKAPADVMMDALVKEFE